MRIGGGVLSLLAGLTSIIMAFVTLSGGGFGVILEGEGADAVIGMGWAGIILSFLIVVSAIAMVVVKSKTPAIITALLSLIASFIGGTLVAIFMVFSMIGCVLNSVGINREIKGRQAK